MKAAGQELEERVAELEGVGLSPREAEAWARREAGIPPREIAEELGIATSTVNTYLQRVRRDVADAERLVETVREGPL